MPKVKELEVHYLCRDIGKKIESWRIYRNMTQSELAEMVDMSQQNYSQKKKTNSYSYADLVKLIRALKVPDDVVIEWMKGKYERNQVKQ